MFLFLLYFQEIAVNHSTLKIIVGDINDTHCKLKQENQPKLSYLEIIIHHTLICTIVSKPAYDFVTI
jgi:hypothetical protein